MVLHHNMARIATETMLHKWKHAAWDNSIVSANVHLAKSPATFPSPDGSFHDPSTELTIAMEFKPPGETKRGILTGLGQNISYLQQYSMSYLVCPEYIEGYKIDSFIKQIYDDNLIGRLPVGLISYSNGEPGNLNLLADIAIKIEDIPKRTLEEDSRYWAKWVDAPPELFWFLLDIAYRVNANNNDRRGVVWRIFFDEYYYPKKYRDKLEVFDSQVHLWNGDPMRPFSGKIKNLRTKVEKGEISKEEAKKKLAHAADSGFAGDNLYNSYRKNYYPFMDHLGLWDDQAYLTELGYDLHRFGKLHGPTSKTFRDRLARIILTEGRHLDLILDIERFTRNEDLTSSKEARIHAYGELEEMGLVKQNLHRSVSGGKKYFENEFQLWGKMGIVRKDSSSYFSSRKGFHFDWREITRIITES